MVDAHRGGGIPWWIWLVVAVVVIAIVWWIMAGGRDRAPAPVDPIANEFMLEEDPFANDLFANDFEATPLENARMETENALDAIENAQAQQ